MKFTGEDVRGREFKVKMRGYNRLEVDAFLFALADWVDQLSRRNEQLATQCKDMSGQYQQLKEEYGGMKKILASVNEIREEAGAKAEAIVRDAEADSERIRSEAESQAREVRVEAERESERLRDEVSSLRELRNNFLLELSQMFRSQIRILEAESSRMGVDLANLLGEESGNVIKLNQKAEGDGA